MSYTTYGVMLGAPPLQWPQTGPLQQPSSSLLYTYIADGETQQGTDALASVAVSIAPSGTGEVAIGALTVTGDTNTINLLMTGGVAGRFYLVQLLLTVASGQVFEVLISFPIDSTLAVYPLPAPPSLGFGTPVTWVAPPP